MMDIACPQCAAAYEIDDATIGASGRKVRCAACGTVWRVELRMDETIPARESETPEEPHEAAVPATESPEEVESTEIDPAEMPPAVAETVPAPPRARWVKGGKRTKTKPPMRQALKWRIAAIAACVVLIAGGLHKRETLVRLLPQTARLYAAIGMPVNLRGIAIRNVVSRISADAGDPFLVVDGDLVNVSARTVDVPRLYFTITGKNGQPLYAWSAQVDRSSLQPGESLNFRRRLAAPPPEGQDVSVRFLMPSDITAGIR